MHVRRPLLAVLVAAFSLLSSRLAVAAPPDDSTRDASDGDAVQPAERSAEQALEAGDLTAARELAKAALEDDPSPRNWSTQARVLDALGDKAAAADAYRGWLAAAPADDPARAQMQARRKALEEEARGKVADEPASTHREELDDARAERDGDRALKPAPLPAPAPTPDDRIVTKWYFWVTLAAIGAAAGAIVGISIKAAEQERKDALDRAPAPPMAPGGAVFRF